MSERATARIEAPLERGAAERPGAPSRRERARTVNRLVVLGIALALAAPSLPARADDKKPAKADRTRVREARRAFEAGKKAYTLSDFDKAIELWKEAYELKDDPIFLYNIAQAFRQKGDGGKAIFYYKGYLRELPDAKNRGEVEEKVADLQKQIDEAEKAAQPAPPAEPAPPPAPPPSVDVRAQTEPPAPVPEEAPRPGKGMRVAGIVSMGAGAAALAGGVVFGLRAKSLASDLEDATRAGMPWSQDLADKESQGKTMNALAIVGYSVGAAAIVTGGILYYLGAQKDARAEERTAIVPAIGPDGARVTLRVSF